MANKFLVFSSPELTGFRGVILLARTQSNQSGLKSHARWLWEWEVEMPLSVPG